MLGNDMQEIEATVVDGNGTETGHIIATTIGGRNGQPKQVQCWGGVDFGRWDGGVAVCAVVEQRMQCRWSVNGAW